MGPKHAPIRTPRIAKAVAHSQQAMSIRYNNLVYEMKAQGQQPIVLSLGEAYFDLPLQPFHELPFPASYHYSHSRGLPELRRVLADYHRHAWATDIDPERELLITAGSKAAIHFALMSLLDPGDEVLLLEPMWVSYPEQVKLCQGVPRSLPIGRPLYELERLVTERSRVLVVNNPNNPIGSVFSGKELEWLLAFAERFGITVLSDEAYSEFVAPGQFISMAALDPERGRTVVCSSVSKNLGMSGWRIGYAIGHSDLIDQMLKVNQHVITCPATILEYYVARYFNLILEQARPQILETLEKRRQVCSVLDELGLDYLPGDGTFYLFVSLKPSVLDSDTFCMRLLNEHGVCVVPGVGYGDSCDGYVRVSVGTESLGSIRGALTRLRDLAHRTSRQP